MLGMEPGTLYMADKCCVAELHSHTSFFLCLLSVCVHTWGAYSRMQARAHLCGNARGAPELMLGVFLDHAPLYLLRQDLSLNLQFSRLASVATSLSWDSLSLPPGCVSVT